MADYLTVRGVAHVIERILDEAEQRVILISPYVQLPPSLERPFKQAIKRGVEIVVVCREKDLKSDQRDALLGLDVKLRYFEELHAKCYCNEKELVIGSLNLYEHSERNNLEMGVLLSREGDQKAFADAIRDVMYIVEHGREHVRRPLRPAPAAAPPKPRGRATPPGYCIRCAARVAYRPQAPLCLSCYDTWAVWGNDAYPERCCHRCGADGATSKARPLCPSCFTLAPFSPVPNRF